MMKCADSEEGIPEIGTPAKEIPGGASFYLSAGLRPAGTGRQAGTGRHHSRTLASSRTSREEAERFLPPAGRRLTGTRWRPSACMFNECSYFLVLCKLLISEVTAVVRSLHPLILAI